MDNLDVACCLYLVVNVLAVYFARFSHVHRECWRRVSKAFQETFERLFGNAFCGVSHKRSLDSHVRVLRIVRKAHCRVGTVEQSVEKEAGDIGMREQKV